MAAPIYSNTFATVEAVKDCYLVTTHFEVEDGGREVAARIILSKFAAHTLLGALSQELRNPAATATVTAFKKSARRKS